MTAAEAEALAATLHASRNALHAVVNGEWITFSGGTQRRHVRYAFLPPENVQARWALYASQNNARVVPAPAKTARQLDVEIAEALSERAPTQTARKQRVRRMAIVTFWGRPNYKAGGQQRLVEFTTSDRFARAWNASGQRFNKSYEIDTQDRGKAFGGYVREDGSIDPNYPARAEPDVGVKSIRPATLKDLKRFKFTLPPGHVLAERIGSCE